MASIKTITKQAKSLLACKNVLALSAKSQSVWTSDKLVKSPFKNVDIPNRTIPEQIWENLGTWPDKQALVCAITNHSYTYHQIYKYSRYLAAALRKKIRIQDNDVVLVMMANSPDYALAMLGILQAGAEVTTVNPIYTAHEVQRQILLSKPKIMIGTPETINVLKDAMKLASLDIPIIAVRTANESIPQGTILFDEFAFDNTIDHSILKEVNKKSEDIAFLLYSSGTTGLPKGVELTNRNIVANLVQMGGEGVKHYTDTTDRNQDSVLGVLPFFHIYGLSAVLLHKLSVGYKVVTLPKFTPTHFCTAMKDHKINMLVAAPPLLLFTGSHKDVTKEHLAYLKVLTSGAAPLPLSDLRKVVDKANPSMSFLQMYGLTETAPIATAMTLNSSNYASSGFALPNTELRVVDSEQKYLGPNEVGELWIRGPQVMRGYRNNPDANKAAFTEDGWFKSGDLAKIDEDGAITVVDRLKELIKVKGYQVPPAELEEILKEHPSIQDAAVIGIPDEKLGEAPKAFVVVKKGQSLQADEVKKFVEERVAAYKRLKEVMFLDVVPKNPSGKILRRVLRDQYGHI